MNAVTRGIRNAFRNSIRTFSIVLILGLSIGLALAMLVARATVEDKIQSVKSTIGNTITITPAGTQGFQGGGEPLTTEQMAKVAAVQNISKVVQTLSDRLTTENTNLKTAIDPGSLGNRAGGNSGVTFQGPPPDGGPQINSSSDNSSSPVMRTFTPPIIVTGSTDTTSASTYGGDTVTFASGRAVDPSSDKDEAVIGKALAEKNGLSVGSTFTAWDKTITVVGIYDTSNTFSNANMVMSLPALQRLSGQAGSVTSATATVNTIDNVDTALAAIKSVLGSAADVVSNQDSAKEAIKPLESVKTISTLSLIGAIAAGAVIILLTMVMIVRERRREIGVFKAIGASNIKVMTQFVSEAVTLTILALIAGLIIGALAANPITKTLVNNSTSSGTTTAPTLNGDTMRSGTGPRIRTFAPGGAVREFGGTTMANARNVQASVGTEIIGYGIATAFIIAIIGSAIPTFLISKVRPAEVMRAE